MNTYVYIYMFTKKTNRVTIRNKDTKNDSKNNCNNDLKTKKKA